MSKSESESEAIAKEQREANRKGKKSGGFQAMGLSSALFKAIIHKGFKVPTPVQRKCIPLILGGGDVVGMARTGSGKSGAFLIPMVILLLKEIEKLKAHSSQVGIRGLILSPSRELALQTMSFTKEFSKYTDLRCCVLVGGDSMEEQFAAFTANPDM
jgi:ATP-dependent RNA helicase DDX54/DBP10